MQFYRTHIAVGSRKYIKDHTNDHEFNNSNDKEVKLYLHFSPHNTRGLYISFSICILCCRNLVQFIDFDLLLFTVIILAGKRAPNVYSWYKNEWRSSNCETKTLKRVCLHLRTFCECNMLFMAWKPFHFKRILFVLADERTCQSVTNFIVF